MNHIREVINYYNPNICEAIKAPDSSVYMKLNKEMEEQMKKITNAESEIEEYYKNGIQTGDWADIRKGWELAAIVHPSDRYFKDFLQILETKDNTYPHWFILDTLAFMPEELWHSAAEVIKEAIDFNNPSWSDDVLHKAFEALDWIRDEDVITFIQQKCRSVDKRIAEMAEYRLHCIYDDWDDEDE